MPTAQRQRLEAASRIAALIVLEGASWSSARRQILTRGTAAPSGAEIESAVREAWALYAPEEHASLLLRLRKAACEILETLQGLDAYLCGAVLNGAAGPETSIRIEVFSDDVKSVEVTLFEACLIPLAIDPEPGPMPCEPIETLGLLWESHAHDEPITVRIEIFPVHLKSRNPRKAIPDAWQSDWEACGRISRQNLLSFL